MTVYLCHAYRPASLAISSFAVLNLNSFTMDENYQNLYLESQERCKVYEKALRSLGGLTLQLSKDGGAMFSSDLSYYKDIIKTALIETEYYLQHKDTIEVDLGSGYVLRYRNSGAAASNVCPEQAFEDFPQSVWTANPDGSLKYVNKAWVLFTGITNKEMQTTSSNNLVHKEDFPTLINAWKKSLISEEPFSCEYRRKRFDGEYFWTMCRCSPCLDDSGKVTSWIGISTDINDLKIGQEKLLQAQKNMAVERQFLDTIFAQLPIAVLAVRSNGEVFLSNKKMASIFQEAPSDTATNATEDKNRWNGVHNDGKDYKMDDWVCFNYLDKVLLFAANFPCDSGRDDHW